jgi:hypothetical protein
VRAVWDTFGYAGEGVSQMRGKGGGAAGWEKILEVDLAHAGETDERSIGLLKQAVAVDLTGYYAIS